MDRYSRTCDVLKSDIDYKKSFQTFLSSDIYENIPIFSLEHAVQPLVYILPDIQRYVCMAKKKCDKPANDLTCDQSAAIMLYSMGWQPSDQCLYVALNKTLQNINRDNIQPWILYIKLFFSAIQHLPSIDSMVYRLSKCDLSKQYRNEEIFFWWDFSLCTILQSEEICHPTDFYTMFIINCHTIKDIRQHTYFQSYNSLLILPGTKFQVVENIHKNSNIHKIILQEIQPSIFFENRKRSAMKSVNIFHRLFSCRKDSNASLFYRNSSLANGNGRNISLEQIIFDNSRRWVIDLDQQNLIDRDMKIIVKHAIIKNHCKRIRLRNNHITSQGALILAEGLNNNRILESLDLRNNYIGDIGVESLAFSISHSNLKTLNLESNEITADGAIYLANMLRVNQTLTELYLSKNHLGDRGIELLANALQDEKVFDHHSHDIKLVSRNKSSSLQHLYLGQNDITDVGIGSLANMLENNRMLTWLWLSGNEISDRGVELLANTLAIHNTTLEWLFLNSNRGITDATVDILIPMLKRNNSLKTIYINNCNLSNFAKQKLQEFIKVKKDFDLEV